MGKILVVDDDLQIAELCQSILEDAGHEVTTAVSSQQFLRCLDKQEYHLLISDIAMPGMNGFACCQKALSLQPNIRILIITGLEDLDSLVEDILKQSPFSLIRKPFDATEFECIVNTCLKTVRT